MRTATLILAGLCCVLAGCGGGDPAPAARSGPDGPDAAGFHPASADVAREHAATSARLSAYPSEDEALARRGFVGRDEDLEIRNPDGEIIWRPS